MNWADFFSMGGRGLFVWGAFGAFLAAVIIEIILVRMRIHRAQAEIREQIIVQKISEQS